MRALLLLIAAASVAGCSNEQPISVNAALPYYLDADLTPEWLPADVESIHQVGDFTLTDQDERSIALPELAGKIVVANFFFTQCQGICPTLTRNLMEVQREFDAQPELLMLSHSVLPEADTPGVLKDYAEFHGIDEEQWRLLTGSREEIERVARSSYLVDLDSNAPTQFLHTENVVLLDRQQRIRGVYNGSLRTDIAQLVKDVATLLELDPPA
ncbi:MAG: SCO family protein [Candidatus Rariloculaceae bacterium]